MNFDRKLAVFGIILALFGTALAIWQYVESRQFAQITYSISHETLFRPSKAVDSYLMVPSRPDGSKSRVTQSIITIWNGGNVSFKGEDIRSKLTLSGDSGVILLYHTVVLTKLLPGSIGFAVQRDDKSLTVDWKLFDPGEAIQIVLLSAGNTSSINLSGRFLSGQEIVRYPVRSTLKSIALFMAFFGGAFCLVLFFGIVSPIIRGFGTSRIVGSAIITASFAIVFVVYGYFSIQMLNSARAFVGDVSPIDPDISYVEIDRKIDYRYVPM